MAKKKFYAVAAGRNCGIFTDWATTEQQVKGFGGAKYKSFPTKTEAESWLENPVYMRKTASSGKSRKEIANRDDDFAGIVIYTDGGAINNPGPGGYGVVIVEGGKEEELSGGYRLTTNNRMEMMAAIVALRTITGKDEPVLLHSDSSYLVNGIEKGWARRWHSNGWIKSDGQKALNADLWQELITLIAKGNVRFKWVKGHAGNPLNERCDRLAVGASRQQDQAVDTGYENSTK